MDIPSEVILIGNGTSMKNYIEECQRELKNKFTIGCNINYRFFDNTIQVFKDRKFYRDYKQELDKLPLVITDTEVDKRDVHEGIIKLSHNVYDYQGWENAFTQIRPKVTDKKGLWTSIFSGLYALSLAMGLMKGQGTIYLLGYDFGNSGKIVNGKKETHYFQKDGDINYSGYGRMKDYDKARIDKWWTPFLKETGVKIYNVVDIPDSRLFQFEKITYNEFFNKLTAQQIDQSELRKTIKKEIKERLNV